MTEYDYSPDALDRYLAKQAGIRTWVEHTHRHPPANPFQPLPGEHIVQLPPYPDTHSVSTNPSPNAPAFHQLPTPPKHKSKHSKHSRSLHSSPQSLNIALPTNVYPVNPQRPPVSRSFTSPPAPVMPYTSPTLQQMHAQSIAYSYGPHPPIGVMTSPHGSPNHGTYAPIVLSPPAPHHPPNPMMGYVQPNPQQPIVLPTGNGGYVVVPAAGQQVQVINPQYHTHYDSHRKHKGSHKDKDDTQSFFGALSLKSRSKSKKDKRRGRGRSDSY